MIQKTLSNTDLQNQTKRYRNTGGISAEACNHGFRPAFLDTQTGAVYPCCFADGKPAPMHLFDGLPQELVVTYSSSGRAIAVKGSLVSGFICSDQFYTREEAVQQIRSLGTVYG